MNYTVRTDKVREVHIDRNTDFSKEFVVTVADKNYNVAIDTTHPDGRVKTLVINNRVYPIDVFRRGDGFPSQVMLKGLSFDVDIEKVATTRYRPPMQEREVSGVVTAQLPGQIVSLYVEEGSEVKKGASLGVLEAMKMENDLLAPKDGIVKKIHVDTRQIIARGDVILEIESVDSEA